jgi:uncharacterized protein (TIGR00159 family)
MNFSFDELWLNIRLADCLDILVVSVLLYHGLKWLLRRSARPAGFVLLGLLSLYLVSRVLRMYLALMVFQYGLVLILILLVIVFQEDLRNAFERISSWRPFQAGESAAIDDEFTQTLAESVDQLARNRVGALIVLVGKQPLERHLRGGVDVDARVSLPLLQSIFDHHSPGHDGAVIVERRRVAKLAVHLPLSANLEIVGEGGTRHAAGVGLTERCDALAIVVSEERGSISIAEQGSLAIVASTAELKQQIERFLTSQPESASDEPPARRWLQAVGLQLFSLLIVCGLWFTLAFRLERVQRTFAAVPIEFRNVPQGWIVEAADPATTMLTLIGPERAFDSLDPSQLKVALDLSDITEGPQEMAIDPDDVKRPVDLEVGDTADNRVKLSAYQTIQARLPVTVQTEGLVPGGYELVRITAEPSRFLVTIPRAQQNQITSLSSDPVDLSPVRNTTTVKTRLRLPRRCQLEPGQSPELRVTIDVRPAQPPQPAPERSP